MTESYPARLRGALAAYDRAVVDDWESAGHVPREVISALGRDGFFRERWQLGAGPGVKHLVALSEQSALVCGGLAVAVMGHAEVFTGALHRLAATEYQRELLSAALDGQAVGCFAATESGGGSDLAGITSRACPVAGGWRLRGRKRYVSNLGQATHALVLANAGGSLPAPSPSLSLFIVPLGVPGAEVTGFFRMTGVRSCDVGELALDVELPPDSLLGAAGLGLVYANALLHFERLSICAQILAAARLALDLAAAFARRRPVGGSLLIGKQAVRHRLAECLAEIWLLDGRLRQLTELTAAGGMPAREVAALKLLAGRACQRVADESAQVMGARGYTASSFPVERLWRDIRMARLGGGTDELLTELIAARLDDQDPSADALLDSYLAADEPR